MGGSYGGRVTHTAAPSAGGRSWRRMSASPSATVASAETMIGSVVMRPPAVSGPYGEEEPHVLGLLGLHELEEVLAALLGQLGDEVGGVVGLHVVEHVGRAVVAERARISTWSASGISSSTSASRSSGSSSATSCRRCAGRSSSVFARSAGFSSGRWR